MPFVLDNSVVTAWYFENQATAYSDGVLQLMGGEIAHVPALWPLEFSNVLRKSISGKNISEALRERSSCKTTAGKILVDTTVSKPGDILSLSLAYGQSHLLMTCSNFVQFE